MDLNAQRLLFECPSGGNASAALTAHNTGSTALHYRWERQKAAPVPTHGPGVFRIVDQHGVILPGALHTFWYVHPLLCSCLYGANANIAQQHIYG